MADGCVLELEEAAFRAWPAAEVVELAGWRLRFTQGVTRRANSVWPNGFREGTSLAERIAAVEAFCAARGIPPSFQLTSAARPADLDAELAARGYAVETPVVVETLELGSLRPLETPGVPPADVLTRVTDEWLVVPVERGRYAGARDVFVGLLERLGERAGYALVRSAGEPVAVGLGVTDGPWLGIFAMSTLPEARRRGAAKAVLRALIAWGAGRGAERAYLQVERDNGAARALYASAGFVPAYDYHYRTKTR
jgi:ribosomal protein S18 acetylase RimI-like enzyme